MTDRSSGAGGGWLAVAHWGTMWGLWHRGALRKLMASPNKKSMAQNQVILWPTSNYYPLEKWRSGLPLGSEGA